MLKVKGIHHISSIVGHAQRNLDFYASILGMRLIKQTINFDDSSTFHFYYGNEAGDTPVVTTFPWNDAKEGHTGSGYVDTTILGVNKGTLDFWEERLNSFDVDSFRYTRFGIERLAFRDPDGLNLEIMETDFGKNNTWEFNKVDEKHAIKGINSAVLSSRVPNATMELLTNVLGFELISEDDEVTQLKISDRLGGTLEIMNKYQEIGKQGVGTVHHIAFAIENGSEAEWIKKLENAGYRPTEVKDRKYFKSIYFRERGGILIELATEGPGFLVDETLEDLGTHLLIPPHYVFIADEIKETLMPITVREIDKLQSYGYRDRYEFEILRKKEAIKKEILELKKKDELSDDEKERLESLKVQLRNVSV